MLLTVKDSSSLSNSSLDLSLEDPFANCYEACLKGDFKQVKQLIKSDSSLVSQSNRDGQSLLYACAASNELEILQWIDAEYPLALKMCGFDGKTLMHIAAEKGYFEMVQWLHKKDPTLIDQADNNELTPLHAVVFHEAIPMLKFFISKLKTNHALIQQIVENNNPKIVAFLQEQEIHPSMVKKSPCVDKRSKKSIRRAKVENVLKNASSKEVNNQTTFGHHFFDHHNFYKKICKQTEGESELYLLLRQLKKDSNPLVQSLASSLMFPGEACIKESKVSLSGDGPLNSNDSLFAPLQLLINDIKALQKELPKSAQDAIDRLKRVQEIYERYISEVCRTQGEERISLLIGKARLKIKGDCYSVPQNIALKIASLNSYGLTNCSNAYGAAAVSRFGPVYCKRPRQNPILPGEDFAIYALHQLICPRKSLTPALLIKLENIWISTANFEGVKQKYESLEKEVIQKYEGQWDDWNNRGFILEKIFEDYPDFKKECSFLSNRMAHNLLFSSGVDGKTLKDYLNQTVSFENFTSMIFLSLLMLPSDARSDNFIVAPSKKSKNKYDIVGIDNDGILLPGIKKNATDHTLGMKSTLFLLPQMNQELDQKYVEFFLSLNPEEIMLEWLSKLKAEEKTYLDLEKEGIFAKSHYRELSLPFKATAQAFITCFKRFKKIHNFLKDHPKVTHYELTENLFSPIAKMYKALLIKNDNDIEKAERRLFKSYGDAEGGAGMQFEDWIEDPIDNNEISEFSWIEKNESLDECIKKFLEHVFPELNEKEQGQWLKNIYHYFPDCEELVLKGCLLNDIDLFRCLSNHPIKKLTLESCSKITEKSLISLLDRQPDLQLVIGNCPKISRKGLTRIHESCERKNQKLSLLLGEKPLLIEKNKLQELLVMCLEEGKTDYAEALVQLGANWTYPYSNKQTLLHKLAGKPCANPISFLMKKGINLNQVDSQGQTPLHIAAEKGQLENVTLFLDNHQDIDCQDSQGRTPLYLAALNGHSEVVKLLINRKAKLGITEKNEKQTALHAAAFYGHLDIIKLLLAEDKELLKIIDVDGRTALHHAVRSSGRADWSDLVRYLIEEGCDPKAENRFKYTPLHFAAQNGYRESAKALIEYRAKIDAYNVTGDDNGQPTTIAKDTPLDLAVRYARDELIFLFLYPEKNLVALPKDLRSPYFEWLQIAKNQGDIITQIFILNRISDCYMSDKALRSKTGDHMAAAKFANAALKLALSVENPQLIDSLLVRLEKVEAEYLFSLKIKSSPENRTYLKNSRLDFEKHYHIAVNTLKAQQDPQQIVQDFSIAMRKLFIQSIEHAITQMDEKPPCKYSILARGDLAKEEVLPYSNIELMVLIPEKNEKNEKYFKSLCKLIDLKLMNLGANLPSLEKEDTLTSSAFCLYSNEINATKFNQSHELIDTPQAMADLQLEAQGKKNFSFHSLCTTSWLTGDKELSSAYQKNLKKVIANGKGDNLKNVLGNQLLEKTLRKIHLSFFKHGEQAEVLDIKNELYDPIHEMLESLIFIYGLPQETKTTEDRLDQIQKNHFFPKKAFAHFKKMFEIVLQLRLETLFSKELIDSHLSDENNHKQLIKEAYQLMFAFFKRMQAFYLEKDKDIFNDFGLVYDDKDFMIIQNKCGETSNIQKFTHDTSHTLISSGLVHQKSNAQDSAIRNFSKARQIYEDRNGKDSPLVGAVCHLIGDALAASNNYREALESYERDQRITESLLGKNHLELGLIYQKMAPCKFHIGYEHEQKEEWAKALEYYESGLFQCSRGTNVNKSLIAEFRNHICDISERYGSILAEREEYKEALNHLKRAVSVMGIISHEDNEFKVRSEERLARLRHLICFCENRI